MESRTVFCGTLLTRLAAEKEEAQRVGGGGRKRSGIRCSAVVISENPRYPHRRRRNGGEGEEERSQRRRGINAGSDAILAADHVRRAIRDPPRSAYDLLIVQGEAQIIFNSHLSGGGCLPC